MHHANITPTNQFLIILRIITYNRGQPHFQKKKHIPTMCYLSSMEPLLLIDGKSLESGCCDVGDFTPGDSLK